MKIDKGTIIGVVVGFGSIAASVLIEHGSLFSYVNVSAGLLVFGGTIGVGLIAYPFAVVMRLPKLVMLAVKEPHHDAAGMVEQFYQLADRARKEGLLSLEQSATTLTNPMLKKGIMLVVDGTDPEVVKAVLEVEVAAREQRHEVGIGMLEALGGFAPTLGILGTVMGLIRILAHMSNAQELGPAIAVAFTATLYGVGSANLLWLPLASKLKRRSAEEAELAALIIDGVAAIQAGDNPRIVQEKLVGYVTPAKGKKAAADGGTPAAPQAKAA
ncbi:MAG TPA: flagellar motor protein [Chloroflexota bacterium]|nr:flagellar motor protein [Chloroflexota bacterium]